MQLRICLLNLINIYNIDYKITVNFGKHIRKQESMKHITLVEFRDKMNENDGNGNVYFQAIFRY